MSLNDFLLYLASAGGASAVASFILERFPWFQNLASDTKRWVFLGVCVFLGIGSYLVMTYVPPVILEQIAPYFAIVAAMFSAIFFGEAFHRFDKRVNG